MKNTKKLTKILALGATSTALLGGVALTNSNTVEASSSIVLLRFKHNAYKYNKHGKRIGKGYISKGSTYYSKGAYKIRGKKYHKLEAKGNIYIKDGNLSPRRLTKQVTLKHNAYQYNKHGKRAKSGVLRKGDSYFVYGSKHIHGKKYYEVGDGLYIKASNCSKVFDTYHKHPDYSDNEVSNNDNTNTLNTNTQSTTTSSTVNNDQKTQNTTQSNANTNINAGTTNNSASTSNASNTQSSATQSSSNNSSSVQKPSTPSTKPENNKGNQTSTPVTKPNTNKDNQTSTPVTKPDTNKGNQTSTPATKPSTNQDKPSTSTQEHTYINHIVLPEGYLETVKKANWEKTNGVPDSLIRKGVALNTFHSEAKSDDEMKINTAYLTPAQKLEINNFALRLINGVRRENGQQPWHYSERGQHVADRIAYLYEQDGMGLSTWHDQKALNQVDNEFGIHTAELMGGEYVNYKEDYLNTMTDLKRAVYSDVVSMLFSTVELEHAQIMLTFNSQDNPTTYFGFAVSWQNKNKYGFQEHSDHFIAY